jgi:hypothetical protein
MGPDDCRQRKASGTSNGNCSEFPPTQLEAQGARLEQPSLTENCWPPILTPCHVSSSKGCRPCTTRFGRNLSGSKPSKPERPAPCFEAPVPSILLLSSSTLARLTNRNCPSFANPKLLSPSLSSLCTLRADSKLVLLALVWPEIFRAFCLCTVRDAGCCRTNVQGMPNASENQDETSGPYASAPGLRTQEEHVYQNLRLTWIAKEGGTRCGDPRKARESALVEEHVLRVIRLIGDGQLREHVLKTMELLGATGKRLLTSHEWTMQQSGFPDAHKAYNLLKDVVLKRQDQNFGVCSAIRGISGALEKIDDLEIVQPQVSSSIQRRPLVAPLSSGGFCVFFMP